MKTALRIIIMAATMLFAGCGTKKSVQSGAAGYDEVHGMREQWTPRVQEQRAAGKYVVILSMDGFRWDLAEHAHTPTLDSIRMAGVYSEIYPCFPANTFPNHYSMATGLHPDRHGIVNNSFFANDLGRAYTMSDTSAVRDGDFYGGEPVWNTAERQGLTANIFMWVGSEAPVNGRYATVWTPYDGKIPYGERADMVVGALTGPVDEIPELIMWYFDEPDGIEHRAGPLAPEAIAKVEEIDRVLKYFCDEARKSPVFDEINFIFTSDHGMAGTSPERHVDVAPLLDGNRIRYFVNGSPLAIEPDEDYLDEAFGILSRQPHMTVYRREEIPERYRYGTNTDRIMPLVVLPETGWKVSYDGRPSRSLGGHGFDPYDRDMHMVFYGAGPDFRVNHTHETFQNLNIYIILCHLLGIEPAPNDCDWDEVKGLFK